MKILKRLVVGFWVFGLLWPQATFAQEAEIDKEKPSEIITLEDMFVHAFHGGAITFSPTSTIIDVDEYIKSGQVERVEDILMNVAGIDIMKSSAVPDPQQVIMLRGFDDSRYVVAIDGRPITGSSGKANTTVDWSSLTTADIEKIEITRGGASARFENSAGGVINIITKKGKKGTRKPKVTVQGDYVLIPEDTKPETFAGRITTEGGINNFGYFFNLGHNKADGYLRGNDWESYDYAARLTYLFPFEGHLALGYKGSEFDSGFAVVNDPSRSDYDPDYPTVLEDADTLRTRELAYPGDENQKKKEVTHFDVAFEQPIKNASLKVHYYYTKSDEDYKYIDSHGNLVSGGGEGYEERHQGLKLESNLNPWENNSLTLGYDYIDHGSVEMERVFIINAGYFEDLWKINSKWTLKTGLRYSAIRQNTYPYADAGSSTSYRHLSHDNFWLPKFTLTHNLRPTTSVFVSVNKDVHIPGC